MHQTGQCVVLQRKVRIAEPCLPRIRSAGGSAGPVVQVRACNTAGHVPSSEYFCWLAKVTCRHMWRVAGCSVRLTCRQFLSCCVSVNLQIWLALPHSRSRESIFACATPRALAASQPPWTRPHPTIQSPLASNHSHHSHLHRSCTSCHSKSSLTYLVPSRGPLLHQLLETFQSDHRGDPCTNERTIE